MHADDPRYALGPARRLKLQAKLDLRKINKYLELHDLFARESWQLGASSTRTARLIHIGNHWCALYVEANQRNDITATQIATGLENILAYQAANPNREPYATRHVRELLA